MLKLKYREKKQMKMTDISYEKRQKYWSNADA